MLVERREVGGQGLRDVLPRDDLRRVGALGAALVDHLRGHVDFVDDNLIGNKKAVRLFLLDLRTAVVSDAAIAALIEAESQPTH